MKSGALQALSLRCRWNKLEANVTSEEYATCEEGNRLLCFVLLGISSKNGVEKPLRRRMG